jgi:hypothetical protein
MDFLTAQEIKDVMGALKGQLPDATYKKVAPLLSNLIAVLERAHDDERRQLREEREALDKEREAVNFARHSLEKDREALENERRIVEREKRLAQQWRQGEEGLAEIKSSLGAEAEPKGPAGQAEDTQAAEGE